jgi:phosphate starvation-inducible membrane PsiE
MTVVRGLFVLFSLYTFIFFEFLTMSMNYHNINQFNTEKYLIKIAVNAVNGKNQVYQRKN